MLISGLRPIDSVRLFYKASSLEINETNLDEIFKLLLKDLHYAEHAIDKWRVSD